MTRSRIILSLITGLSGITNYQSLYIWTFYPESPVYFRNIIINYNYSEGPSLNEIQLSRSALYSLNFGLYLRGGQRVATRQANV